MAYTLRTVSCTAHLVRPPAHRTTLSPGPTVCAVSAQVEGHIVATGGPHGAG